MSTRERYEYPNEFTEGIRERISRVAAERRGLSESDAYDAGFHMVDWIADLHDLWRFFEDPGSVGDEELAEILVCFLVHAPNHIAAAATLICDNPVRDVFGVGATAHREDRDLPESGLGERG